jgi:hypothetical protein
MFLCGCVLYIIHLFFLLIKCEIEIWPHRKPMQYSVGRYEANEVRLIFMYDFSIKLIYFFWHNSIKLIYNSIQWKKIYTCSTLFCETLLGWGIYSSIFFVAMYYQQLGYNKLMRLSYYICFHSIFCWHFYLYLYIIYIMIFLRSSLHFQENLFRWSSIRAS